MDQTNQKLQRFVVLILALLPWAIAQAQDPWRTVPSGVGVELFDISFSDSLNGWIAGDTDVILRTRDGGESWTRVAMTDSVSVLEPVLVRDVEAEGSIVYALLVGKRGYALLKCDTSRGEWSTVLAANPTDSVRTQLTHVAFASPVHGVAVTWSRATGKFTSHFTDDGGLSWSTTEFAAGEYRDQFGKLHYTGTVVGVEMLDSSRYNILARSSISGSGERSLLLSGVRDLLYLAYERGFYWAPRTFCVENDTSVILASNTLWRFHNPYLDELAGSLADVIHLACSRDLLAVVVPRDRGRVARSTDNARTWIWSDVNDSILRVAWATPTMAFGIGLAGTIRKLDLNPSASAYDTLRAPSMPACELVDGVVRCMLVAGMPSGRLVIVDLLGRTIASQTITQERSRVNGPALIGHEAQPLFYRYESNGRVMTGRLR